MAQITTTANENRAIYPSVSPSRSIASLRALEMAARSQDLAVEKTQTDGTPCACTHTDTETHTHTTRGSIHLNVIRPSWVDHTNINLKRQSVACLCVCVCVFASVMCVCVCVHVLLLLLLNICPVSQQRISGFDFSIILDSLWQLAGTRRPTEPESEELTHAHVHFVFEFAVNKCLLYSSQRQKDLMWCGKTSNIAMT